ncbi:hypothetical protein [Rhizobium leguminosarum]|uniref:hypothetical protein n=1 Tax=Rhizobium leguminosarum TaxID=384 RepID=UPI001AECD94F|nr:hypothetical protein [Rhizobium leguminosarum]
MIYPITPTGQRNLARLQGRQATFDRSALDDRMIDQRFRPAGMAASRLLVGLLLGGAGYVGYFVSAAFAVQLAGAAIPPVIIGTMPVLLAIIANIRDRSAPWQVLALPLMLIAVGVAIVNIATIHTADPSTKATITLGILASFVALAIWIIYGLRP